MGTWLGRDNRNCLCVCAPVAEMITEGPRGQVKGKRMKNDGADNYDQSQRPGKKLAEEPHQRSEVMA